MVDVNKTGLQNTSFFGGIPQDSNDFSHFICHYFSGNRLSSFADRENARKKEQGESGHFKPQDRTACTTMRL